MAKNIAMRSSPSSFGHNDGNTGTGTGTGAGERVRWLRARHRSPYRGLPAVVLMACAVFASVAVLALHS